MLKNKNSGFISEAFMNSNNLNRIPDYFVTKYFRNVVFILVEIVFAFSRPKEIFLVLSFRLAVN